MKCKICGSETFEAHQELHVDVICDGDGDFIDNLAETLEASISESWNPYGPFTCTHCGAVYDELEDGAKVEDVTFLYAPIKGHPTRYAVIDFFLIRDTGDKVMVEPYVKDIFDACDPIDFKSLVSTSDWDRTVPTWLVSKWDGVTVVSRKEIDRTRGVKA